ncbi:MAG: hypothetical protein ABIS50_03660 [Luteolibacter sp.]|uniref:hypothetical protein n=1 Tax=Luteolibacter sp. TaxID=1962973 RepID=UPI0032633F6B
MSDFEVGLPVLFAASILRGFQQDVTIRLTLPVLVGCFRNRGGCGSDQAVKVCEVQFSRGDHQKIYGISPQLLRGTEPISVPATTGFTVRSFHYRAEQVDQIFGVAGTLALARLLIAKKIEAMCFALAEN